MTTPLAEKRTSVMNSVPATPSALRRDTIASSTPTVSTPDDYESAQSSPFVSEVANVSSIENAPPIKSTSPTFDRPLSSQLRPLKTRATPSPVKTSADGRSPRKITSPIKRFPVKVSIGSVDTPVLQEHNVSLDEVVKSETLRENEGLTRAIQILEDEDSVLDYGQKDVADDTMITNGDEMEIDFDDNFADQTAFSTFSAVPDMTMFAKLGHSPNKTSSMNQASRPQSYAGRTPTSARTTEYADQDDSPTPRKSANGRHDNGNTTNLLDITEQFSNLGNKGEHSPSRTGRLSPSKTAQGLLSYSQNARTPSPSKRRQISPTDRMSHLLDFDIPPAPTPRSMPSITPRELESLKSTFLSEISSLKASLSGKEAEVQSLKAAVGDAEKRVGESMQHLREEETLRSQMAAEKEDWEKRAREMEAVLRNVRSDLEQGEKDREALEGRLQESEMRRDMAETMAQEAESKMAGMKAGSAALSASTGSDSGVKSTPGSREVEIAVEKVARELHTLYKGKHETKVAALKRSYETKWDRKVKDLQEKLEEAKKEIDDLHQNSNANMSAALPRQSEAELQLSEDLKQQAARESQHARELEARLEGLSEEISSVKRDNDILRQDLERERVEKGELVAACDELLTLQEATPTPAPTQTESFRSSVSRIAPSGLRAPGVRPMSSYANGGMAAAAKGTSSPSRLVKLDRHRSVGSVGSQSGLTRPGSGLAMRSGIMSNIEKMGSYKGRDASH